MESTSFEVHFDCKHCDIPQTTKMKGSLFSIKRSLIFREPAVKVAVKCTYCGEENHFFTDLE